MATKRTAPRAGGASCYKVLKERSWQQAVQALESWVCFLGCSFEVYCKVSANPPVLNLSSTVNSYYVGLDVTKRISCIKKGWKPNSLLFTELKNSTFQVHSEVDPHGLTFLELRHTSVLISRQDSSNLPISQSTTTCLDGPRYLPDRCCTQLPSEGTSFSIVFVFDFFKWALRLVLMTSICKHIGLLLLLSHFSRVWLCATP